MREVRQERTGWRDLALSERHRRWGWDCPAVDLDFVEYDQGRAMAVVEYKHERALPVDVESASILAVVDLGTRAGVPVFLTIYTDDFSMTVTPLNWLARWHTEHAQMTEREWITFLYRVRGRDGVPEHVFRNLGL